MNPERFIYPEEKRMFNVPLQLSKNIAGTGDGTKGKIKGIIRV
jgi:hypothetical protein